MPDHEETDAIEINVRPRHVLLAIAVLVVLVLGAVGVILSRQQPSQRGYHVTLRCLPDLHFDGVLHQFPSVSPVGAPPSATPPLGNYREVVSGPCDLPAGSPLQSGRTAATVCVTTTAVHIPPGAAAMAVCTPTNTLPAHDLLGVCLADDPAFINGQAISDVNDVCTLWIEAASYQA